ncbi:MAG: hypothetical protein RL318_808 [Fibrobacterota bacterium]
MTTNPGFGVKLAPAIQMDFNEQFAVRANVGYEFTTWGEEVKGLSWQDYQTHRVTAGVDAVFAVIPKVQLLAGLGVDIPVHDDSDGLRRWEDANGNIISSKGGVGVLEPKTSMFVDVGAGYVISPSLSVNAKYKLALTEYYKTVFIDHPNYDVKLNQIQAGVSYNFGN